MSEEERKIPRWIKSRQSAFSRYADNLGKLAKTSVDAAKADRIYANNELLKYQKLKIEQPLLTFF